MKSKSSGPIKREIVAYIYILPALMLIMVFLVWPIIDAMRLSLFKSTLEIQKFIGFNNFLNLIRDSVFIKAARNTVLYATMIVLLVVNVSMFAAATIYRFKPRVTALFRGIFYLPTIASAVTVSVIWNWIFNPVIGIANHVLSFLRIGGVEWFASPITAFFCVVLVSFVCSIGQPIIIYTAALGGISKEYYEASELEGASEFQQFLRITIPLLRPTTMYVLVITSINSFQIFIPIQLLTGGGPVNATTSILYELYRTAFLYNDYGYASGMGMVLFVIIGLIAIAQFRLMRERN